MSAGDDLILLEEVTKESRATNFLVGTTICETLDPLSIFRRFVLGFPASPSGRANGLFFGILSAPTSGILDDWVTSRRLGTRWMTGSPAIWHKQRFGKEKNSDVSVRRYTIASSPILERAMSIILSTQHSAKVAHRVSSSSHSGARNTVIVVFMK